MTREAGLPPVAQVISIGHGWRLKNGGTTIGIYDFRSRSVLPAPKMWLNSALVDGHLVYTGVDYIGRVRRPDGSTVLLVDAMPATLRQALPDGASSTLVEPAAELARAYVWIEGRGFSFDPVHDEWRSERVSLRDVYFAGRWTVEREERSVGGLPVYRTMEGEECRIESVWASQLLDRRDGTALVFDSNTCAIVRVRSSGQVEPLYPR